VNATARERYFGTAISPRTFEAWLAAIADALGAGKRRHLSGHHNLHSLHLLHSDDAVAAFYRRCDDCYIDGVPVRLILAGFGERTSGADRFSLMDRFPDLLRAATARGWSLFYLGSAPEVVATARRRIEREYPDLRITLHHGYFEEDAPVVAAINAERPDVLLVGMGMPKQEAWLLANLDRLDVGWATQAGATLDYFAGAQARPPGWMSRAGLAWLYRLASDPARLWHRYLVEPWSLLPPTLRAWKTHRATGPANDG